MLAVIETHPVQYHAPVYQALQRDFEVPVTAIYGSDFSVVGFRDPEFQTAFAWDTDLLGGYSAMFLERGLANAAQVTTAGLAGALKRIAPDAILLLGYSPQFYCAALMIAWRTGKPMLFRAETADHAVPRGALKSLVRDSVLRAVYGACDRLLYVGKHSYQHYRRLGCSDAKLVFSPYCVDVSAFRTDDMARDALRAATRQRLGIEPHEKVLLVAGKLVPRKRPDLVLDAVQQLRPQLRQDTRLLVLGDGEMRDALAARASAANPPVPVSFVGFQNQKQLSAYYHAADLLVLASDHNETWGLVVNEALHHGVPCVVSDRVGCAPDLIETDATGGTFQAGSAASLAAALERAWPMIGTADVRTHCRQKVTGYTVSRAAEGVASAYTAAIHRA